MNVHGTRRIVQLCHKMTHLVALVHVSTAYCNCNRNEIEETVYPMSVSPQQIIETMQYVFVPSITNQ